jgi:hypothetical protein
LNRPTRKFASASSGDFASFSVAGATFAASACNNRTFASFSSAVFNSDASPSAFAPACAAMAD